MRIISFIALALFASSGYAGWHMNMPQGVTSSSNEIFDLHQLIMYICAVIGLIVTGGIAYCLVKFRHSKGAKPEKWDENLLAEISWTVVPTIILILMAIPATKTLAKLYDTSNSEIDILVTGYQWKWQYEYINEDVSFFSNLSTPRDQIENTAPKGEHYLLEVDEPMVVPVGSKVRLLLTAKDVIHSWWVPEFGVKKDAVPGFINESWMIVDEPGVYRGQCTELCGKDHGFMPVVVHAVSKEEYAGWVASKKEEAAQAALASMKSYSMSELMAEGESAYNRVCAACHQVGGQGVPPTFPSLIKSPYIVGDVANHIDIVVNGKPGTMMQAFGPQLTDLEVAAIVTYERNAWGNDMGDMVQPADVAAMRAAKE